MKKVMSAVLFLLVWVTLQAQHKTSKRIASSTNTYSQLPYVPREIYPPEHYIGINYRGNWQSRYSNGQLCDSGYLKNNMPDGIWKSWYPNGQLRMMMECNAKKLVATKNEMQRIYKPGYSPPPHLQEMKDIMNDDESLPYEKLMYRQMYLSIHPPGLKDSAAELLVTVEEGDTVKTFMTNALPFTECLVHGRYVTWFPDGTRKDSGYCNEGIRQGVWEEWNEDGTVRAVGFYRNGMRWKDWRYFNKEGKLLYIRWYNRSEEVTETIVLN